MADISKLSANKLQAAYDRQAEVWRLITRELIDAGRGMEKGAPSRLKTDALAVRNIKAADALAAIGDEMHRRMRWHGSLKPIRVARAKAR